MVEKFQMTGSAMGKKIIEELEKKLSALVLEWNEVSKKSFCILVLLCGEHKASVHLPVTLSKLLPYEARGIQELFPPHWEPRN
jgi:cytochrome bd-type quinol oxidase subunit 1